MLFRITCGLLALVHLSTGLVQFKNSTILDITDFTGATEVVLEQCELGCLIYASMTEEGSAYMENLYIYDKQGRFEQQLASIASIARMKDDTSRKLSFNLGRSGVYSIRNMNAPDATPYDVTVYVVDRLTAYSLNYEIYDAKSMARVNAVPMSIITVMAAKRFVVQSDKGADNSFTARLTGPDNAQDGNGDSCINAYQTNKFEGFEFHVNGPIVSIVFDKKNLVAVRANYNWSNTRNLSMAGFISSPGYHGCASGDPMHVYRQLNVGFKAAEYDLFSGNLVNVVFTARINVTEDIVFTDVTNSHISTVQGEQNTYQLTMDNTQYANVYYSDASPPYGFIARHTATKV